MSATLSEILEALIAFRAERDWEQFHTPRNLTTALAIEAAELQEVLLWRSDIEVRELSASPEGQLAIRRELADVLIYALLFCHDLGIDPLEAILDKLVENADKYPISIARSSAKKYTDLKQSAE